MTGNGTGTVTITATSSAINATLAALNGLIYTPTPNVNGPDTLTMTSDSGDTRSDVDMVAINVAAVNDAPTVAGDGTEEAAHIVEDMPSATGQTVASLFGGQYSDAADQVSRRLRRPTPSPASRSPPTARTRPPASGNISTARSG